MFSKFQSKSLDVGMDMKISEILREDSICVRMAVESKDELLLKMMELAKKSGKITDSNIAMKEVIERECIMSTGIGKGIAIPHAKTNSVESSIGAFALLEEPLDYEALDGEEVRIVFMLLGRENHVGNHLRLLSKISRLMNNDSFRAQLLSANNPSQILDIFSTIDETE